MARRIGERRSDGVPAVKDDRAARFPADLLAPPMVSAEPAALRARSFLPWPFAHGRFCHGRMHLAIRPFRLTSRSEPTI